MSKNTVIKAARRSVTGKQVKILRRQGLLPAVLYGNSVEPITITLNAHEASLVMPTLSSSTIVTIELEGEQYATLVREKQKDFIKNSLLHVDFQIVSQTETIKTAVRVDTHGISPAVKDFDAVIVHSLSQVEVEALPRDLPERYSVDISKLVAVGDALYVRDLPASDKVQILTSGDELIVVATSAAPEEIDETVAVDEPEVIERGKKEEEE